MNNPNIKKPKNCVGKENFERMNYLYQISHLMSNISPVASTHYGNLMVNIAKRSVMRIDPHIKRTLCRRCHILLVPGQTCKITTSKKDNMIYHKCTQCSYIRRYVLNKARKLHNDKEEAIVEYLDYGIVDNENKTQEKS